MPLPSGYVLDQDSTPLPEERMDLPALKDKAKKLKPAKVPKGYVLVPPGQDVDTFMKSIRTKKPGQISPGGAPVATEESERARQSKLGTTMPDLISGTKNAIETPLLPAMSPEMKSMTDWIAANVLTGVGNPRLPGVRPSAQDRAKSRDIAAGVAEGTYDQLRSLTSPSNLAVMAAAQSPSC